MNEAEWLASEDPAAMLEHVRGKIGERKLRLWVEANRCVQCESAWSGIGWSWTAKAAYLAGASCPTPQRKAALLREIVGNPFRPVCNGIVWQEKKDGEYTGREYWVNPRWLTWNDGLVSRLARAAYDEMLPDGTLDCSRLLVLADALEEAGCAEEELLRHLRGEGGPHVPGCWALDLLLGLDD